MCWAAMTGVIHFTVGQRKGLGVAAAEPLYVLRIEPETRRVVVGPHEALGARRVSLGGVNWLGPQRRRRTGFKASVKLRSAQPPLPGHRHARRPGRRRSRAGRARFRRSARPGLRRL